MDALAYLLFRKTEISRITRRVVYSEFWEGHHCYRELQFKWVRVFELEITEEKFKWLEVSSMADSANFLSGTHSFIVRVAEFLKYREDCIFQWCSQFSCWKWWVWSLLPRCVWYEAERVRIDDYPLEDNEHHERVVQCYLVYTKSPLDLDGMYVLFHCWYSIRPSFITFDHIKKFVPGREKFYQNILLSNSSRKYESSLLSHWSILCDNRYATLIVE